MLPQYVWSVLSSCCQPADGLVVALSAPAPADPRPVWQSCDSNRSSCTAAISQQLESAQTQAMPGTDSSAAT